MKNVQLHTVARIIAGQSPESSTYNSIGDGLPFFQGKADFQEKYPQVRVWCNSKIRKEAEPGDILMSVRAPVGSVNICNQQSIIGRGLSAIRPDSSLDGEYLYYFLKSNEQKIASLGTGSTFKAITQDTLKKIEISLPPLDDQIRIAHLLGKVGGLISQRKGNLRQLDDLLKSIFLDMFGDPVLNEKEWKKEPLVELTQFITDGKHGDCNNDEGSGYYFISAKDIHDGIIDYSQARQIVKDEFEEVHRRTDLRTNDLVMVNTGATIGKMAIVQPDPRTMKTTFQKSVAVIKPKTDIINVIYLKTLFEIRLKDLVNASSGSAQQNLLLSQMRKIPVTLPPIDIQNQFAAIVEKIEGIKFQYLQSLTELENLYGGLSQKAFKGDLDLSRIPVDLAICEVQETKEDLTIEETLSENIETTLSDLNAFNKNASSLMTVQETIRNSKIELPQIDSIKRVAEQLASLRSPVDELKRMSSIAITMEQLNPSLSAIKSFNLEQSESIKKSVELARKLSLDIPKVDMSCIERHSEALKRITGPFDTMRKAMEQISMPSKQLQDALSGYSETAKRLQSSIPDFATWQKLTIDPNAVDFGDEEVEFKRSFTREDVASIFANNAEPLSFDRLLRQLNELEPIGFVGYETIKGILFELLSEQQLVQFFDDEQKTLLLRIAP